MSKSRVSSFFHEKQFSFLTAAATTEISDAGANLGDPKVRISVNIRTGLRRAQLEEKNFDTSVAQGLECGWCFPRQGDNLIRLHSFHIN